MTPDLRPLPPKDAIAYFRQKGLQESFAWQDVYQEEHAKAFTVAKMMQRDLLQDTRQALDAALSDGTTFEQFKAELAPKLKAKGWWGKQLMGDPLTGEVKVAQLGSNRRLKTIFDVNMRTSYQAGNWARIERTKKTFPFLMYTCVGGPSGDGRNRPQHLAWHGVCLPVDDPWWDTHYPPCGWRCRCGTISLTAKMMAARGLKVDAPPRFEPTVYENPRTGEVTTVERGIDPGFNFNVGKAPMRGLTPRPAPTKPGQPGAPSKQSEAAAKTFLKAFKAEDKARVIKDREGWPLPVSTDLFQDAKGYYVVPRPDLIADLPAVADALKTYDRSEWVWANKLRPEAQVMQDVNKVIADSHGTATSLAVIAPVPKPLVDLAKSHGMKLDGFDQVMDAGAVRHIRNQHGDPKAEAKKRQIAVGDADFRLLPELLRLPDSVEFGRRDQRGRAAIKFTAARDGIEYVIVKTYHPSAKTLTLKTFYKSAEKSSTGVDADHKDDPNLDALDGGEFTGNVIDLRPQRKLWQSFTQVHLVRRYTKTLDNQTITIDFSPESWTFDIRPLP